MVEQAGMNMFFFRRVWLFWILYESLWWMSILPLICLWNKPKSIFNRRFSKDSILKFLRSVL
jgi:hypothetical protein